MPGSQSLSKPQTFNFDLADPSLTGFASNVTGASWALTATAAPDGLAHQVSLRNDSGNSKAGINVTFVGTDPDGNALTETIAGPAGSATVETAGYFKTLTSVTPASTWGADTGDIGYVDEIASPIIMINWLAENIAAINTDVTGTINFTLQQTFDTFLDKSAPSQQVQWITIASSKTADGIFNSVGGALGVRLLVNSYSNGAEIQLNVNPTYVANQPDGGGTGPDVDATIVGPLGQALMAASIPVVIASDQSVIPVGGNVASGATDSGNPAKIGGVFNTATPTVTNGQRVDAQADSRGNLRTLTTNITYATADGVTFANLGTAARQDASSAALTVQGEVLLNGAGTWDRARSVVAGQDTTGTGIPAAGILAQFDDTTPSAVTENQFGPLRMASTRALYVQEGPYVAGRATADAQIKAGAGFIHTVTIGAVGTVTAGVITIYDSLTETGTVIFSVALPITTFTPFSVTLDVPVGTGIYVGFDATLANVQATLSYR